MVVVPVPAPCVLPAGAWRRAERVWPADPGDGQHLLLKLLPGVGIVAERGHAGPAGPVVNVSIISAPKSAGQLNSPAGNKASPSITVAILATLAGLVTVTTGSSRSSFLSVWYPNSGVMVTTRASAGIRSAVGRAGSQTTCASTRIAV